MPYVNTEAMNLHLKEISQNVARGAHAVIIIDGAGWHRAYDLLVPNNITLLPLPPYSPELNAQENVWQYLRQNYLAGRIFDTYTSIVDASPKCNENCANALPALPAINPTAATIVINLRNFVSPSLTFIRLP